MQDEPQETIDDRRPPANDESPAPVPQEVTADSRPPATDESPAVDSAPPSDIAEEVAIVDRPPAAVESPATVMAPPSEVAEEVTTVDHPPAAEASPAAVSAPPPAVVEELPAEDHSQEAEPAHHIREYPRFRLMARIEHMTLLVSFTILCLTGLPQKFPFSPLSQGLISVMGGIEVVRLIHRWAAIVLILGTVYHLLTSAYRLFVKHEDMRMLPDLKDGLDMRDTIAYNLGFIDEPPKMRKFNFGEKFEYWAVVWGTAVMIITGFILWNPIAATQFIPGNLIPVALEAHGWEAVLAAVSIVIWHLYNVLVKHRNLSMFTGVLSHKIMEEEHALELERLDEGGDPWKVVPPEILARRRRIYFALASVVTVLALALVVWMFTFEDTAIIVQPEATRDVFVPLATPQP